MQVRTRADVATQLSLSVSTFNATVKNHEVTEISYNWCSPFSKQQKSIKYLLLEGLEPTAAAQFEQESVSNVLAHPAKLIHLAACLGVDNFMVFNKWESRFKG
jgi:DNA-binding CsgD family transcriptional regulator